MESWSPALVHAAPHPPVFAQVQAAAAAGDEAAMKQAVEAFVGPSRAGRGGRPRGSGQRGRSRKDSDEDDTELDSDEESTEVGWRGICYVGLG